MVFLWESTEATQALLGPLAGLSLPFVPPMALCPCGNCTGDTKEAIRVLSLHPLAQREKGLILANVLLKNATVGGKRASIYARPT
jgi:hypothetical protein